MAPRQFTGSLAKSVLVGGAAAASLAGLMALMLASSFIEGWTQAGLVARLLILVAGISFGIVLAGTLLFGLPTTLLLSRLGKESETAYVLAGTLLGFVGAVAALLTAGGALDGLWLGVVGAVGGGLAGRTWWRTYRKHCVERH